jgi:hypothetical protein
MDSRNEILNDPNEKADRILGPPFLKIDSPLTEAYQLLSRSGL